MDGRNTVLLEDLFQPQVEVRRVNADEDVRRISQKTTLEVAPDAEDFAIMPEHFDVTADGQLLERMPGVEASPTNFGPPTPENTTFGSLACSACISWLASKSPDASPATMAMRTTAGVIE